jgi:uncharacterized membrane protein YvbJ
VQNVTDFYNGLAATAKSLLTRFGRDITHRKIVEGDYNPDTATVSNSTVDTTVKAVDFDFRDKTHGNQYFNQNIQASDRYALVSADVDSIDVSDQLIIGGVTWNIINVKTLAPAGTNVLFTCHIRK